MQNNNFGSVQEKMASECTGLQVVSRHSCNTEAERKSRPGTIFSLITIDAYLLNVICTRKG